MPADTVRVDPLTFVLSLALAFILGRMSPRKATHRIGLVNLCVHSRDARGEKDAAAVRAWLAGRKWLKCEACGNVLDPADDVEARCEVDEDGKVLAYCVPCSEKP